MAEGTLEKTGSKAGGQKPRDRWSSRTTFIIASVGAAVGLGNIWRFPYLNYEHGGGAFLIPYFFFLITTGLPLLQAELGLGRLFQKGDVMAFGSIHKRARGAGAVSVVGGFGVVTYYSSIIATSVYFFGASFKWPFPWAITCDEDDSSCNSDPSQILPIPTARNYFDWVMSTSEENLEAGRADTISGPLFGTLLITWIFAYFCIWKGVSSVGSAVKITVILPWILLAILIIYNATLPGARDGVKAYIGTWDMDVLNNGAAWSDAAGQIFFTLGATLGIMSAYGSYAPTSSDIFADNSMICYINCFTSLMAGFAVFSILGNMAQRQTDIAAGNPALREAICNQDSMDSCPAGFDCSDCRGDDWATYGACCGAVQTDNVADAGIYLAFSVYPATMQYLPEGGANILSLMWFGVLWLLGIDSMFAMVEGVATVITDTPRFSHLPKPLVALVTCILGFIASISFITDIGFFLLDTFDHYLLNFGCILTGAIESYVVSWVWGWKEINGRCGKLCAAIFTYGFTAATLLGVIIAGSLHYAVPSGSNVGIGIAIGFFIFGVTSAVAFVMRSNKEAGLLQWISIVGFAGSRNLRYSFKHNPRKWETYIHMVSFDFMIKYVCPPALLGLFVNQVVNDAVSFDSGYQDYPIWLQCVAGILVLGLMFVAFMVFAIHPGFWDSIGGPEHELQESSEAGGSSTSDLESGKEAAKGQDGSAPYLPKLPQEVADGWAAQSEAKANKPGLLARLRGK